LLDYFNGEKNAGLLLIRIGIMGVAAAASFFQARWGFRSFAVTLGVFALAEIALGMGLYLRTAPQVATLLTLFGSDVARLFSQEGARMVRVQRNFVVVQYVELGLIVIAAFTAVAQKNRFWLSGIALGVPLHAAFSARVRSRSRASRRGLSGCY
jgi:hypothetical protein